MRFDDHVTVHDMRGSRATADRSTPRAPAWEWSTAELSSDEHRELEELRGRCADMQARIDELHVAAQAAHDREQALRRALDRLTTGSLRQRRRAARELRGDRAVSR